MFCCCCWKFNCNDIWNSMNFYRQFQENFIPFRCLSLYIFFSLSFSFEMPGKGGLEKISRITHGYRVFTDRKLETELPKTYDPITTKTITESQFIFMSTNQCRRHIWNLCLFCLFLENVWCDCQSNGKLKGYNSHCRPCEWC